MRTKIFESHKCWPRHGAYIYRNSHMPEKKKAYNSGKLQVALNNVLHIQSWQGEN